MIKVVTFKTNHTVMGDVTEVVDAIQVKKPVQVISVPPSRENPQGVIGFAPFLEFTDEWQVGIEIDLEDILTVNTPVRELENQYNEVFGSGIQIAAAGSIPKV